MIENISFDFDDDNNIILPHRIEEENLFAVCPKCFSIPLLRIIPSQPDKIQIICTCSSEQVLCIKNYIDTLKSEQQLNQKCEIFQEHSDKAANNFCVNCQHWLCDECFKYHSKFNPEHKTMKSKVEIKTKCERHKDNNVDHYCIKCKKHICNDCKNEHNNHQLIDLLNYIDKAQIEELTNKLNQAEIILNNRNIKIKNYILNRINELIAKIENVSEKHLSTNTYLIKFIRILLSNANSGYLNYNFLVNLKNNMNVNFNEIEIKSENIDSVIKKLLSYYQSQFIISTYSVNMEKLKMIRELRIHKQKVNCIIILKDGRLASGSSDQMIKVTNLSQFSVDLSITAHKGPVNSLCQLPNGNLVSCSSDRTIKTWKLSHLLIEAERTIAEHKGEVIKVIQLSKNRMASCANDCTIKIFDDTEPYRLIQSIQLNQSNAVSILQIKDKELLASISTDKTLCFWSLITYKCESAIFDIECIHNNSMLEIVKERLIIGSYKGIIIVNINTYEVMKKIVIEKFYKLTDLTWGGISSYTTLRDGSILVGCPDGGLFQINSETLEREWKNDKNHADSITELLTIGDKTIVSCSSDTSIKFWNY